jgi:preprotein translocase subunit SecF
MFVIQFRKLFASISVILMVLSTASLFIFGLKPSIDFTGGALVEVSTQGASQQEIRDVVQTIAQDSTSVRPTDGGFIVRTRELTPQELSALEITFTALGKETVIERTSIVGPSLGEELFRKALIAIVLVSLGIIIFVGIAFWRVSKPVSSWVYGLVTLGTLFHDVIIPAGVFALLGFTLGIEVDALFVVALLTVLGYSVNDTIVVMDRIRENLRINQEKEMHEEFDRTVGKSLNQTYARSINTSLTTIMVLLALFFFGGTQTEDFALALLIGVAAGAYSSIFFASPLLVMIEKMQKKKKV